MSLPPTVEKELDRSFAEPDRAAARQLLPQEHAFGDGYERILLAIIGLSNGSLSTLAHYSQSARDDWRDVLSWHENPREPDEPTSYSELREQLGLPPDPEHADQ